MTELKTLQWGNDTGLSELAHLLRIGISFLTVVRGNRTMVGSLEKFYVKKIAYIIAGFEDGGRSYDSRNVDVL